MKKILILSLLLFASIARGDYLGSWKIDAYLTFTCTTHKFSTGAAFAATGNVNFRVYEDDTDTEIETDTAMTAFDGVTGLYLYKIQLDTATGYEAGKHYTILIQATVDGVSAICTHNFQVLAAVDIESLKGSTLSESTGGNIATNFGAFYDNGDSVTTASDIDDIRATLTDTATTIPATITDIKGTNFVKDEQSLIDIFNKCGRGRYGG